MPKQVPTKRVTKRDAADFLLKAGEFLRAAKENLDLALYSAATSNAVHAGINASDAITGFRIGRRASARDHAQALELLKQTAEGAEAVKDLAPLLTIKPQAEYDPKPVTKSIAARSLRRAEDLLDIATTVAGSR